MIDLERFGDDESAFLYYQARRLEQAQDDALLFANDPTDRLAYERECDWERLAVPTRVIAGLKGGEVGRRRCKTRRAA